MSDPDALKLFMVYPIICNINYTYICLMFKCNFSSIIWVLKGERNTSGHKLTMKKNMQEDRFNVVFID
jgi:hypothetical protein